MVSNTHWDREFRFSFEKTRHNLLVMLDTTLDILESDENYHSFTMDGHSIMIDDYLEMRPERKEQVEKFIREGRLIIPLSIPVIVTVSLFTFNGQFGNFFWPNLVITNPEKYTLGVQVYKIQQAVNANLTDDIKMMGILFAVLPQLLVFSLFQKHIIGGINLGGVKG